MEVAMGLVVRSKCASDDQDRVVEAVALAIDGASLDGTIAQARAAILAHKQALGEQGKTIVPRTPTDRMLDAGNRESVLDKDDLGEMWSAMIWAAHS
jgi:hypothetical protein